MAESKSQSLKEFDPELYDIICAEYDRQFFGIELIASENFTSRPVMECLGSCLTNKYSEGYPDHRYYGGNEQIDKIEKLCQQRALTAFGLDEKEWGVNVQPYSGSPANFAVYTALLQPHDRMMGLDLPSGGHLTHGFYTATKRVSATSKYFESFPYKVNDDGFVDYDKMEEIALTYMPKLIICDKVKAIMMTDMAHFSGLVAGKVLDSPFTHSDIVTTTTHKSLRGPRSGMIFFRRQYQRDIEDAVFPGLQGGPHDHQVAAVATQLKEVGSAEWANYAKRVVANSKALAKGLMDRGNKLMTNGTDNHLMMWDLRPHKLTGSKYELICDEVAITVNKNTVAGDKSALTPGGVRIGTCAVTTRGMEEKDMDTIAGFLDRACQLAIKIQTETGVKKLTDFKDKFADYHADIEALKKEVRDFAATFHMPGIKP